MEPRTLYRPSGAWVGDVIPFFHDGSYWLYYLHDRRPAAGAPRGTARHLPRPTARHLAAGGTGAGGPVLRGWLLPGVSA